MARDSSETKHNLLDTYGFVTKNAPLTVGQYLDDICPERRTNAEHAEYAKVMLETFKTVSKDDLFDMDLPVTEASVIRGFTPHGLACMRFLLKMAERNLI